MTGMIAKLAGMITAKAGLEWAVDFIVEFLYGLDKDSEGWDDKLAFTIEKTVGIIKLGSDKKIKQACFESLDLIQYHLENLDDNTEGMDDEIARKISDLKKYFTD